MKYRVVGGSYTRNEGTALKPEFVTYDHGAELDVSAKELKAFPTTFEAIITPRTEEDEAREAQLETQVTTLQAEVTSLTIERNGLKTELANAQKSGSKTSDAKELTRLKAENAELQRQLGEATKPPEPVEAAELKTNPGEGAPAAETK